MHVLSADICVIVMCCAAGPDRAQQAALKAIQSPLLDTGIDKATGVVWNISGPSDMTLSEVRPH